MGISYGRLGKREWEARFPGGKEQEKKKKNGTTLHEILQSKKCKEVRAKESRLESIEIPITLWLVTVVQFIIIGKLMLHVR